MTKAEGTIVKEDTTVEKMFVSGLAVDTDIARISIVGLRDVPGVAYKIFSLLARKKISVDIILQSIGRGNTKDISFTIHNSDLDAALKALEQGKDIIGYEHISHNEDIAKLSVVGAGMATNPGVASLMFEALADVGINIHMISTSEIKISVLIDKDDVKTGARAVHNKFLAVQENGK